MQVELFTGVVNETNTTVNVTLNPRLSGVTKLKVHSFPPRQCVLATLWVCFDAAIGKKSDRLGLHSEQSVGEGGIQQQISPTSKEKRQQQDDGGGGTQDDLTSLIMSTWRSVPIKSKLLHKISKRAASGNAASSGATPRTCKRV